MAALQPLVPKALEIDTAGSRSSAGAVHDERRAAENWARPPGSSFHRSTSDLRPPRDLTPGLVPEPGRGEPDRGWRARSGSSRTARGWVSNGTERRSATSRSALARPRPAACTLRYAPIGPVLPAAVGTLEHFLVSATSCTVRTRPALLGPRHHAPTTPGGRVSALEENLLAAARLARGSGPRSSITPAVWTWTCCAARAAERAGVVADKREARRRDQRYAQDAARNHRKNRPMAATARLGVAERQPAHVADQLDAGQAPTQRVGNRLVPDRHSEHPAHRVGPAAGRRSAGASPRQKPRPRWRATRKRRPDGAPVMMDAGPRTRQCDERPPPTPRKACPARVPQAVGDGRKQRQRHFRTPWPRSPRRRCPPAPGGSSRSEALAHRAILGLRHPRAAARGGSDGGEQRQQVAQEVDAVGGSEPTREQDARERRSGDHRDFREAWTRRQVSRDPRRGEQSQ